MKLTVARKMALLTAAALVGLAILIGVGQIEMDKVYDGANFGNVNAVPSLVVLGDLRKSFQRVDIEVERHILTFDDTQMAQIEIVLNVNRRAASDAIRRYETDGCLGANCFADDTDKNYLEQEKVLWANFDSQLEAILVESRKGEAGLAKARDMVNATDPLADKIIDLINQHIDYNVVIARKFSDEAATAKRRALYLTLTVGALLIAAIAVIGALTSRAIVRQLGGEPDDAAAIASLLAAGDLSGRITLKPGDRTSMMAKIKSLLEAMERLANRADAIGQGNLDEEVALLSERDRLGKAINSMIFMLRTGRAEDQRRNWLKDGYSQISAALTGDLTTEQMANAAIEQLGRYLEAGRGVFYLYRAASQQLDLIGSYMYTERKNVGARFALGEGAIGQVAREKKPIILTVRPDAEDTALVVTGTTASTPLYTYSYPLLHEKELVGVLELAGFERYDDKKIEFLATITGMLASFVFVAEQRAHIRKLLIASKSSEQELRLQSQQLQDANALMEEQQQQLQQQTEELQQSNAQMEETQQQLQQQTEELQQGNAQMEETQQQLEQKNQELLESQRLQEERAVQLDQASRYKSEFLANMSHELRTPLNSIILLSKMMTSSEKGRLEGEALKWAQVINRSGEDLLRLINEVLDLSKVEAGHMELHVEPISSQALSEELHGLFEHAAEDKGLAFTIDDRIHGDFVSDADKLGQILRNLLSNAIKFTKQGGISLSLSRRPGERLPICLSVKDTGIGIPDDKRAVIFDAFQQADGSTSREFGGTGLGLTISLRFAEMLGGTITLRSVAGQGSEFMVLLPETPPQSRKPDHLAPTAPADKAVRVPMSGSQKPPAQSVADDRDTLQETDEVVLLIDDDPIFGQALVRINRQFGYKTLVALTGAEGLELAQKHRPKGILLDLGLPDMDGTEVLHSLKSNRELAAIPVHIVSARDHDEAVLHQGAMGFLQKPTDDRRLVAAEVALLVAADKVADNILVFENGGITAAAVSAIVGPERGTVAAAGSGDAADSALRQHPSRLVIIDLGKGKTIKSSMAIAAGLRGVNPAIALMFFADQAPDAEQEADLRRYSDCVIVKSPQAKRRLRENIERFLHEVPRAQANQPADLAVDGKDLDGKHILVVDDDPRNLFVITAALERHGATLSNAVNGRRALEFLEAQRVDLVLMDIMMPEMDGYQVIAAIRNTPSLANIPVVALTAKALPSDRDKILAQGADDYLTKPVDYDLLVARAAKWCNGRTV